MELLINSNSNSNSWEILLTISIAIAIEPKMSIAIVISILLISSGSQRICVHTGNALTTYVQCSVCIEMVYDLSPI